MQKAHGSKLKAHGSNARVARQLVLLLIVALVPRLVAGFWWQARQEDVPGVGFGFGDSQSYWTLAQAIARGEPYQYGSDEARVFRAPGYPLLLAPIFLFGDDEPSVYLARAMSALFGTLAVGGVWWLGRELFNERAGLLAGAIAAVYPGAIAMSMLVLSEAPFCPLMLLNLALWTAAWQAPSPRRAALLAVCAGLSAGAAALVRPSWLLFSPFAIVAGLMIVKEKWRQLGVGVGVLVGLTLAMTPWWIRNARVTGHFVPTTLQVGASLYDGLSPTASGASNMDFVVSFVEAERRSKPAPSEGLPEEPFEYRLDRRLHGAALAWASAHPGEALRLAATKFTRIWNIWPNEPSLSSWPMRLMVAIAYVPVLLLAIAGAGRTIHRGWPYILCWLPAVYFTLIHVVFVSSIRYRQPAMLPLIVLAAGFVVSCWKASDENERRGTGDSC